MSSATAKKPPVPGTATARRQSTNPTTTTSTTPSRSPSRISTQNATGTAAAPPINRTRSIRTGTPVSARAAARKPTLTNDADNEAKAELQVKMEELQEQLRLAEENSADVQKQAAVLQAKLDEALKEQGNLEENVHEHTERINDLENDKKESLRARREMEQIYESERAAFMKEREETQTKEDEMQASMQRMKESLAQREMRAGLDGEGKPNMSRNSSFRNSMSSSPNPDAGQFAPPSVQRSDSNSRNNSRLVMQKDKVIEGLRLELAEAHIRIVEMENLGGGRLQKMETEMYEVKVQNARLMEENESFQLLLSEKTLNGDFSNSEFLRPHSNAGSRPSTSHATTGNTLADELEGEDDGDVSEDVRKLQAEVVAAKDQNKALTLYINNIISRLLQHDQFEQILDKTPDLMSGAPIASSRAPNPPNTEKELPPPPPEKDEQPTGLLQRARSVMGGKKSRPQSQIITSDQAPKMNENPDTAPRVALTDRRSMSGHRRANSEFGPASVVNNMYRGPSPGSMGPGSPGLGSPTQRPVSYFGAAPLGARMPSAGRLPSGNSVPTIAEVTASTPKSEIPAGAGPTSAPNVNRLSTPSNPSSDPQEESGETSNPASPPRSVTSSGDREARAAGTGAIMMGSKMRPLRLVKETEDESAAKNKANRGSWFGWMNKGGPPPQIDPSTRLRRAIQLNDPVLVARLIRLHPTLLSNPDFAQRSNTSLHLAASTGSVPIISLLVSAGHESTGIARNALQETPLMLAAREGHVPAARALVEAFPRCVAMVDAKGLDALALCARSGSGESTALIPVLLALEPSLAHSRDADGNTPLHHASAAGNLAALRILLSAGANPLAKNDCDWTPLAYSQTVAAEVYFKNLVAEFERRKVEGMRVGEERERQRAAGVRLVNLEEGGMQQTHEEIPEMGSRQWSPGDRGGVVVKDRRPERGLGIEIGRMRAGSGD